jgi:hypothetical protein
MSSEVLYRFDGDLSATPVTQLADEVRLRLAEAPAKVRSRLFSNFVEMTQNVIHYAEADPRPGGPRRHGAIALGRDSKGYWVSCTNRVGQDHALRLRQRLEAIRQMSPEDITAAYRRKLNDDGHRKADPMSRGAGLGLLSIARNSSHPLSYDLDGDRGSFTFSIRATL